MPRLDLDHQRKEQLLTQNADELEVIAGREKENLRGWNPALDTDGKVREAMERAFDYRGDVTLTLRDGRVIEGYVFDRRVGKTLAESCVRLIPTTDRVKLKFAYSEVAAINFSGRDTAEGKSFEAWVKKYREKKAAGEKDISIQPDSLDE